MNDTPSTPMLRQYAEARAQAGDALILFRLGDFFELFYDDAKVAAALLGITLTSRAKGDERIPMAGVPVHAAQGYIAKLVAAGHKVALCDQVEAPAPGKALVRREIVRLVTPGTLLDEESLDGRDALLLAAVALEPREEPSNPLRAALALLDASTGELRALPPMGWEALLDELSRARPRELLVPEWIARGPQAAELRRASGALRLEPIAPRAPAAAQRLLEQHLGLATLDGLGLGGEPLCVQACAEALGYLQSTQRSLARHVVGVQLERPARALWIDPSAVRNLELFRGPDGRRQGTLLAHVDRTLTAPGGRLLARWLGAPLLSLEQIAARHDAVEEVAGAAVVREELAESLRGLLDLERLLGRLAIGHGSPRDLGGLRSSLARLPTLASRLSARTAARLRLLAPPLLALGPLSDLLQRALVDEVPGGRDPRFVRPGYRSELDELADLAQGGRASIAALEQGERARTGIQSLKVRFNRVSGFYLEVTKPNLHLVPPDFVRRGSTVGAERFVTPALEAHEQRVLSAEDRREALEAAIFEELRAAILAQSAPLRVAAEAVAEADALLSFARVAVDQGWVRPALDDSGSLEIVAGRHPVVEQALQLAGGGPFVPNDLALDEGRQLLVLTGPNMAGKSTAMRQVALLVILAQAGSFVPAQRARIGLVDRLFTRVGAADDLARGQSTFMVEMAECARILHQATTRSLLLLDEVGRGTSTFDGLALAWAIAEHLHDAVRARTLFATHYHELCDLAAERPRVVNLTMAVTEVDGGVVFLRKVIPGAASRSYGIQVARLAGLPSGVVERARQILANLEAQELDEAGHATLARRGLRSPSAQRELFREPSREPPAAVSPGPSTAPAPAPAHPYPSSRAAPILDALARLDLSRTTPLEALTALHRWQDELRAKK